jgi:hypothetical protein
MISLQMTIRNIWGMAVTLLLAMSLAGCANTPAPNPALVEEGQTQTVEVSQTSPPPPDTPKPVNPTGTPLIRPTPVVSKTFQAIPLTEETVIHGPSKPTPQEPAIAGLVEQARQDLASRLSVQADVIEFVSFESVVWPDGSLGCPQPGMMYTQVQKDGYKIVLKFGEQEYAYHGGGSRPPFLCEQAK